MNALLPAFALKAFQYCRENVGLKVCVCIGYPDDGSARHIVIKVDQSLDCDLSGLGRSTTELDVCLSCTYEPDDLGDLILINDVDKIRLALNCFPV